MEKIPTVDEFFSQKFNNPHVPLRERTRNEILYVTKEFAKLHVKAALETAAQNAKHVHSAYDSDFKINKQSILDSYSEDLIK